MSDSMLSSGHLGLQQQNLMLSLQNLLGDEQSALHVAQALSGGAEKPNVSTLMEKAGLGKIQDDFCADSEVYTAMSLAATVAKRKSLQCFTYVELTSQHLLPAKEGFASHQHAA